MTNPIPVQGLSEDVQRGIDWLRGKFGSADPQALLRSADAIEGMACADSVALAEALDERDALQTAARDLIASRFDTYRAGNNRQVGIQDDSGEKCWIVPFDTMAALEASLVTELQHSRAEAAAPSPVAFVTPETMKDILAQSMWTLGAVGEFRCDNRQGFTVPLYALPIAVSASPASPSATGVRVSEHVQFRLKWKAAARLPVHPEPMEGSQTFDTLDACARFMSQQAADAELVSVTEIRSVSTDVTNSLSALGEHP